MQIIRYWRRSHASGGDGTNQGWKTGVLVSDGHRWMHVLIVDDSTVRIERIDPADEYTVVGEVTPRTVMSLAQGCEHRLMNEDAAQAIDQMVLSLPEISGS